MIFHPSLTAILNKDCATLTTEVTKPLFVLQSEDAVVTETRSDRQDDKRGVKKISPLLSNSKPFLHEKEFIEIHAAAGRTESRRGTQVEKVKYSNSLPLAVGRHYVNLSLVICYES
jgi:hypothetical protein